MENRCQCPAFEGLRTQPGDHNPEYASAFAEGRTGFPMVDACMRCLLATGWVNFRMRAMLASFAAYNLWLDWRHTGKHLARTFLDYEPGIHYPQLQMQAGVTGINALRVYNVVKQGRDNDPSGVFIRRYIPELRNVPLKHLHEPSRMTAAEQAACGVVIAAEAPTAPVDNRQWYASPIVDAEETSREAKQRISAVARKPETKQAAREVYLKHGSRRGVGTSEEPAKKPAGTRAGRGRGACSCGRVEWMIHGCTCCGGRGGGGGRGRGRGRVAGRGGGAKAPEPPGSEASKQTTLLQFSQAAAAKRSAAEISTDEDDTPTEAASVLIDSLGGEVSAAHSQHQVETDSASKRARSIGASSASSAASKVNWGMLFDINAASAQEAQAPPPQSLPTPVASLRQPLLRPEAAGAGASSGAAAQAAVGWACAACTFRNHAALPECEMCETARKL